MYASYKSAERPGAVKDQLMDAAYDGSVHVSAGQSMIIRNMKIHELTKD